MFQKGSLSCLFFVNSFRLSAYLNLYFITWTALEDFSLVFVCNVINAVFIFLVCFLCLSFH